MSYHQDWFMRQIEALVCMVSRMLFQKDTVTVSQFAQYPGVTETETELLAHLLELIRQGDICGAENRLYEEISPDRPGVFPVAVQFYNALNQLSDPELEVQNFSREEILDGIKEVCRVYGFDPDLGFTGPI